MDSEVSNVNRKNTRLKRLETEIHRLRNSPSLRLGSLITNSISKPWRAPFLPITLPWMMLMVGLEMLGWKSPPPALSNNSSGRLKSKGDCIVMFPTNGVGFGHFTRMLSIAKRMKKINSDLEIVFFTTMPTLNLLKHYGIPAHHISGRKYFKNMSAEEWNALLEDELNICLETHRPSMFMFDGAFPYRGMLRSIQGKSSINKIWMRRGTFRKNSSIPTDSIEHFDAIIHPGDSVSPTSDSLDHDVKIIKCPPIVMLEENELFSREKARLRLGLPEEAIVVYVQLGAGEINDINSEISLTVSTLVKNPKIHVVIGESLIGERIDNTFPRVHILRDYPNSMYFNGFDATVQAGGYNSFHETRTFSLPALFYPNMNTGMDDQLARCKVAENEGWGLVLENRSQKSIEGAISRLLDLRNNIPKIDCNNGGDEISKELLTMIQRDM